MACYNNPYFFLYATLATNDGEELHFSNGTKTTAGSVVQSVHKLKDIDNKDGGFFVFADISVRLEGLFRLKFTLFEIAGSEVQSLCSALSEPFQVFSPKCFPGMSESTFLTRSFSDQGVRIRIRKETRVKATTKRRRGVDQRRDSEDVSSTTFSGSPRQRPTLPSPTEILTTMNTNHVMSMDNLLLSDTPRVSSAYYPHYHAPSESSRSSSDVYARKLPPPHPRGSGTPPSQTIATTPSAVSMDYFYYCPSSPEPTPAPSYSLPYARTRYGDPRPPLFEHHE
ncbi:hypothetical protein DFQ30_001954 [Apophysomyces sp. BC1015]|nr:hypothetical protein DFQ30_001954 [Apophysomyces sp. BC1015]